MAIPFSNLQPQRSRVLPQGGAILGQLTGSFARGLEQGRMRAAEDQAPGLIMDWLDSQAAGYQPQIGALMPATGYVAQPSQPDPSMVPGSPTFNGADAMRTARQQADAGIPQPPPVPAGGGGVDAGVRMLDQFEGFSATPYEDWSYRAGTGERYMSGMRIGYGQDATGMPATVTQEQAQAALRQQIEQQYVPAIVRTIGPDAWGRMTPDQQGVLISLVHNYGSLPNRILDEIATGDPNAIGQAIAALGGDNNGINQNRRAAEAAAFTGAGMPAGGGSRGTASAPQQGGWQPPTGQERAMLRALIVNPVTRDMGIQLAMQRMTPPTPEPVNYGFTEVGGVLYRTNPQTGQAEPVAGNPNQARPEDIVTVNGQLVNRRTGEVVGDYRDPATVAATEAPETRNLIGPDGQLHAFGYNPQTGLFDIDFGLADPGGQFSVTVGPDGTMQVTQGRGGAPRTTPEEIRAAEVDQANLVLNNIDRAFSLSDQAWTTGFMGARLRGVEGQPAYDLAQTVATIQANVGFAQLQAMRDASPTGGALGQVTERELAFLQSVMGSLETAQSREQFQANLRAVQAAYLDIVHGRGNWSIGDDGRVTVGAAPAATGAPTPPPGVPQGAPAAVDANGNWLYWNGTAWVPPNG